MWFNYSVMLSGQEGLFKSDRLWSHACSCLNYYCHVTAGLELFHMGRILCTRMNISAPEILLNAKFSMRRASR